METPIKLELVGRKGELFALKYPGLQIPIHVNDELLEKFKASDEYVVVENLSTAEYSEQSWSSSEIKNQIRA
ncbi:MULTISPECIES: hypothetical protein [Leeuwenhoekiella]|uniref:hypothetical protein n=1 Tax=Leeuwenhoekiella TaxID=283735 RepID=UPI000C4AC487|nr:MULTISPECIES: hypothetical protein [Leeuwenhoekiella]MAO44600.1 hypothetical protein [Leeuwenhoekiella sp.]|tara:strand:- start:3066 stop:3281 length:216 start_codon:yes stop_codon:yes gene_type:complete